MAYIFALYVACAYNRGDFDLPLCSYGGGGCFLMK